MKIFYSVVFPVWRWQHTAESMAVTGDAQLPAQRPLYQLVTTTNTMWSHSIWHLGTKRGMFCWKLRAIRSRTLAGVFIRVLLQQKMANPLCECHPVSHYTVTSWDTHPSPHIQLHWHHYSHHLVTWRAFHTDISSHSRSELKGKAPKCQTGWHIPNSSFLLKNHRTHLHICFTSQFHLKLIRTFSFPIHRSHTFPLMTEPQQHVLFLNNTVNHPESPARISALPRKTHYLHIK